MPTPLYTFFDFDDSRLADRTRIIRLMEDIAIGYGARFLKKAIVCSDVPGEMHVPSEPEWLDQAWSNAVRAAPRYNGQYWMEFEHADGLKMSFGFDPRRLKRLSLTVDRDALRGDAAQLHAACLLDTIALMATSLGPPYAFGLFNYDTQDVPPVGAPPAAIWDYQVFGPALVDQIGRDRLAALPAHEVRVLPDGAVLVAMSASPVLAWQARRDAYRAAAQALGLAGVMHDG
jgi:hypothetical protein